MGVGSRHPPGGAVQVVWVVADGPSGLRLLRRSVREAPTRRRHGAARVRLVAAPRGRDAEPRDGVSAVALDVLRPDAIEVIQDLRERRADMPILAYGKDVPASEAMAAIAAGADHFHATGDDEGLACALQTAIDRRRLSRFVEENEAAADAARERLRRLQGGLSVLAGFRPPPSRESVVPFRDAARAYLVAAAKRFEGDARGLAEKLGVSYSALRRLLRRYAVPFPGRRRAARAKNVDRRR